MDDGSDASQAMIELKGEGISDSCTSFVKKVIEDAEGVLAQGETVATKGGQDKDRLGWVAYIVAPVATGLFYLMGMLNGKSPAVLQRFRTFIDMRTKEQVEQL